MHLERDAQCVVVGLGVSGMAAVRFLHKLGMKVLVSEQSPLKAIDRSLLNEIAEMEVGIETGGHTIDFFQGADLVVPSPGVPLDLPILTELRSMGKNIAGELALAAGRITSSVIGVTGSNGKTTVTSLIGHLLKDRERQIFVGGNIGTPVLEYLQGKQDAEAVVLELSSFQLEIGGEFRPDIGLLLNLSPDHIDRHGTLENYAAAKRRIFANQTIDDVAIICADDPLVMEEKIATAGTVLSFGLDRRADARVMPEGIVIRAEVFGQGKEEFYDVRNTAMETTVNRLNTAAAILAARAFGCYPEAIRERLVDFIPPPHRMSLVADIEGVRYIDDSKGTNVGAVAAALGSCGDRVILIAGGRDKGSDFGLLSEPVRKNVVQLILIGEAAERIEESLGKLVPVSRAGSMEEAVGKAAELSRSGDTVLLSPGCASFDMFESYSHRGDVFQEAVHNLQKLHHNCC